MISFVNNYLLQLRAVFFMFKKEIDGVVMGSPLGPTLADAFLCFHETKWLSNCPPGFKPLIYCQYVDVTFLVFKKK